MKVVGLTGGIGMGKSFVAGVFRREGVAVFDADAAVHRLQARGGAALPAIARAFPGVVTGGVLDRAALRAIVLGDAAARRRLEAIVHPLVRAAQARFVARARAAGAADGGAGCASAVRDGGAIGAWIMWWWSVRRRMCSGRGCGRGGG